MTAYHFTASFTQSPAAVSQRLADLEHAPAWHTGLTAHKRTAGEIGLGTEWQMHYGVLGLQVPFVLTIVEWTPEKFVRFRGTKVAGVVPAFSARFVASGGGTTVHFTVQPQIPLPMRLPFALVMAVFGSRDVKRYFVQLAAQLDAEAVSAPPLPQRV